MKCFKVKWRSPRGNCAVCYPRILFGKKWLDSSEFWPKKGEERTNSRDVLDMRMTKFAYRVDLIKL